MRAQQQNQQRPAPHDDPAGVHTETHRQGHPYFAAEPQRGRRRHKPFGALATSLAATIGTGNIIGVATAVAAGGPGAVLWMWLTGVFGIATKYSESLLSVHYRQKMPSGQMAGGPMYVLQHGMKCRWLAVLFAIFTAIAAFGIGNMVQANAISSLGKEQFNIAPWLTGLCMAALTAMVVLGGIKSIAKVCQALVPVMALIYVGGCLVLLIAKADSLPSTIVLIFNSAFTGQAAVGGFLGAGLKEAMRMGVSRGLFSNESGLGSAPIVAAAAQTTHPVRQALVSASGTFWDTVVICAMTGLVVVNSGHWTEGLSAAALTRAAFNDLPIVGSNLLVFGLLTFVFSTILGWSYYGEKAIEYLLGTKAIFYYRCLWIGAVMVGAVFTLKTVWNFADVANACMAIPNLVSLLVLSGVVAEQSRNYFSGKAGLALPAEKELESASVQ